MEKTEKDKKKFEKIITLVQRSKKVPSRIKAKVEKIKKQVEGVKVCHTIRYGYNAVDYKTVLKVLKEVLLKHCRKLPKSIQREIK